ncbi:hypothetical protein FRUB_00646 [Fimbriiglobus ruber]|uniref:Uncharacterized protein n=1 Tax=Fimbriiglobus ruber TaxID=1908690 RepID=A0A225EFC9_9BACT|nr:hypothetical protein FRUB_00646 [Fimbriiglobus ruber]
MAGTNMAHLLRFFRCRCCCDFLPGLYPVFTDPAPRSPGFSPFGGFATVW